MIALAGAALATALLAQAAAPPMRGEGPEITLSCRIKGPDRVRFRVQSSPVRGRPATNPRLRYATVRVTGIDRGRAHLDARSLAAIDAQLKTFSHLQGGAHVICANRRASLVILGWQGSTPVSLVLKAPAQGLAGFVVPPLRPGWTAH